MAQAALTLQVQGQSLPLRGGLQHHPLPSPQHRLEAFPTATVPGLPGSQLAPFQMSPLNGKRADTLGENELFLLIFQTNMALTLPLCAISLLCQEAFTPLPSF